MTEPVGDFGRKEASVFHDSFLPGIGNQAMKLREQSYSTYELTDEERILRDTAWDLVRPPHRDDWAANFKFSLVWANIAPEAWYELKANDYYLSLIDESVSSHETRFEKIIQQANGDASRLPVFRQIATKVSKADGARRAALRALAANNAMRGQAELRIAENTRIVEWVEQAMRKRIYAYRTALGRLMVETPSTKAVDAEAAIDALEWEVTGSENTRRAAPLRPLSTPRSNAFHPSSSVEDTSYVK